MSYNIVKSISIKKDGKIMINSRCNNDTAGYSVGEWYNFYPKNQDVKNKIGILLGDIMDGMLKLLDSCNFNKYIIELQKQCGNFPDWRELDTQEYDKLKEQYINKNIDTFCKIIKLK